jgi:hypothetical protein
MLRANKRVKYLVVLSVLLSSFWLNGAPSISAQQTQKLSATPRAFQTFYTKFRKAVIARNKTAVASLTRFPFEYGFDAGDEGTFSRTEFLKRFNDLLGGDRPIFASSNPSFYAEPGRYELVDESDASHYIFEKTGASYQFTAYVSEP